MNTTFPQSIDLFPQLDPSDTLFANTANHYQSALVSCQSQLESLYIKATTTTKKLIGLVYRVQISSLPDDADHYLSNHGFTPGDRPNTPWSLAENKSKATFRMTPLSPVSGSFITLAIPGDITIPHSQPFHPSNSHFVTVECSQHAQVGDARESIVEYEEIGSQPKAGGSFLREGILYHNGVSDMNPKYVLTDWSTLIVDNRRSGQLRTTFNFYIHYVIVG